MNQLLFPTLVVLTLGAIPLQAWSQADEKKPEGLTLRSRNRNWQNSVRFSHRSTNCLPRRHAGWKCKPAQRNKKPGIAVGCFASRKAKSSCCPNLAGMGNFDKKKLTAKKPPADFTWSDVWAVRDGDFAKFCRDFVGCEEEGK